MARDLGDWQTPRDLADAVLALLRSLEGEPWERVLEPTCGTGVFISASLSGDSPPSEVIGIDIQPGHLAVAKAGLPDTDSRATFIEGDIFGMDLIGLPWRLPKGPLLVVGNPPWVTNAELGSLDSSNLPQKLNIKGLRGFDAITGAANFDIAEYITLKLISELAPERPTVALLLKTSVARKVIQHCRDARWPVGAASMYRFDAKGAFGAAVDACLLVAKVGDANQAIEVPVFDSLTGREPVQVMGFPNGHLVPDIIAYRKASFIDGSSPVTWRQGLKHDAARVMELTRDGDRMFNGMGEVVEVEPDYVYPLLKGTQLHHGNTATTDRAVIVPQQRLSDDTRALEWNAPKLWRYLERHRGILDSRRSSIYKGKPPFAVFGVGEYTFTPFKIAVSGLHKQPRFRLVGPIDDRPVVLDDTCYLLPCDTPEEAALTMALLHQPVVRDLINGLIFTDSKRPVTKKLLQRIDLAAALESSDPNLIRPETASWLDSVGITSDLRDDVPGLEDLPGSWTLPGI